MVQNNMDLVSTILENSTKERNKYNSIGIEKHTNLENDLGTLLTINSNVLDDQALRSRKDDYIESITRNSLQFLFNELWELPFERVEEALVVKLPPQKFVLPRFQPVPKPKSLTKWQQFAKDKGIQKKKKAKLSWDEQLKKWVPLYGFKRVRAEKDKDWVLEVPQNADPMEDQFAKKATAKGERIAKNELQRMRNVAKAKNVKIPRLGLLNPDVSTAKDLQTAVTVARASTASVGKFQSKLPHEKEARGVAAITPGASRKRKLPPVSGAIEKSENLAIVDSVLNKRPKIDIEKAVSRHINNEQLQRSEEKVNEKPNPNKRFNKNKGGKKPKGTRKGKVSTGRKRR